jgi:hypothetical protein
MKDKEIVKIIREHYPKYDKYLHSKVKRPELYAIRLIEEAEKLISPEKPQEARRTDRHRLKGRVSCRLSERKKRRLQLALKRKGITSMQDGLTYIIDWFLGEQNAK